MRKHPSRWRSWAINIGTSLMSLVICFGVFEGIARLFYTPLRDGQGIYEFDGERWWALRKNITMTEHGTEIVTNSYGHRDVEFPVVKPEGERRIIVLGDSVSFGHGLPQGSTYSSLLERRFADEGRYLQVVNTSTPGNGPWQEVIDLKRAVQFSPDLILYQFCLNDLVEPFWVSKQLGGDGNDYHGVLQLPAVDHALSTRSALYVALRSLVFDVAGPGDAPDAERLQLYSMNRLFLPEAQEYNDELWAEMYRSLDAMRAIAEERGVPFMIVASPMQVQMLQTADEAIPQRKLEAYAATHGSVYVDLLPVLQQRMINAYAAENKRATVALADVPRDYANNFWTVYFLDTIHPDEDGHALFTEQIAARLDAIGF